MSSFEINLWCFCFLVVCFIFTCIKKDPILIYKFVISVIAVNQYSILHFVFLSDSTGGGCFSTVCSVTCCCSAMLKPPGDHRLFGDSSQMICELLIIFIKVKPTWKDSAESRCKSHSCSCLRTKTCLSLSLFFLFYCRSIRCLPSSSIIAVCAR